MKIAQFKRIGNEFEYLTLLEQQVAEHYPYSNPHEYVRMTEWAEVTLVPRSPEDSAREQLDALDSAEVELRRKFTEKLDQIASERAKLRALTHEVSPL